jgi:pyruvate dehydrogenase E1 component alpha subunit
MSATDTAQSNAAANAKGQRPAKRDAKGERPSDALSTETLTKWLEDMLLIREFELRTMAAYQQAKIGGFCHIYIGQEACAVGTIGSIHHHEPVITAYRDHGHALARGMSPEACMGEMFGKLAGCAKGKGGSMHMFDKPNNLYGGHGIVGAQTPLGAGLAFATRYEWEVLGKRLDGSEALKQVCLCYLGDGALNQGAFHEACNLAGLYDLPVIYVVENNGYSMGTSIARGTTEADNLGAKAAAYGMDYLEFDGMDVLDVYDHFKPFADRCRENQRPGFVNLITYRYQGHSMSDPQKYRTKDEVETYKNERDPILSLKQAMVDDRGVLSEDEFKDMNKRVKDRVKQAMKTAESMADPELAELFSDVYVNIQPGLSPSATYAHGSVNALLDEVGKREERDGD